MKPKRLPIRMLVSKNELPPTLNSALFFFWKGFEWTSPFFKKEALESCVLGYLSSHEVLRSALSASVLLLYPYDYFVLAYEPYQHY